ncbi:MAG: molybdenum cofactor guanylyltransferase [Acidobacteria bacterium]|nr:molybdenum cofactor guanylyltransferase [Acidobacteriota bacterium]
MKVSAYIIAGGEGKRLGQPKWSIELGGGPIITRVAAALSAVASVGTATVVAKNQIEIAGLPVITDSPPAGLDDAGGPLVGLYTALRDAQSEWLIAAACDLPFVSGELFKRLLTECSDDRAAVVPIQPDGTPQPLCAAYRVSACRPAAEKAIADGRLSMFSLLDRVQTRFIPFEDLADLPSSELFFFNINTPEDLAKATEIIRTGR